MMGGKGLALNWESSNDLQRSTQHANGKYNNQSSDSQRLVIANFSKRQWSRQNTSVHIRTLDSGGVQTYNSFAFI